MSEDRATYGRKRRTAKPLDRVRLEELAVSYVARFATSAGKLKAYLQRKIRERGMADGENPDVDGIVDRCVAKGFVDDTAYGRAKARDLSARGYGGRRVEQALRAAGLDDEVRAQVGPDEPAEREAVIILARKRRFGPFGPPIEGDAEVRRRTQEKRLAAMVRAGHDFAAARRVIEAVTIEELEEWVAEAAQDSD